MGLDQRSIVLGAASLAAAGIALLFLMAETPRKATVAEAMIAEENSLLVIYGTAQNATFGKFMLCDRLCILVRAGNIPSSHLLFSGRSAAVTGRVRQFRGSRYLEAEKIEVG
ncbi:MAG: hypothetical protein N3E51_01980 [Candidatus Micrarchaeota archaeon]|nr:hypothetical protein [Candidatus Micrarchaeota archaeon]